MNLPTIITIIIVAAAAVFAVAAIIRRKKQGKSYCGGGCAGCPMSGGCGKEKENVTEGTVAKKAAGKVGRKYTENR